MPNKRLTIISVIAALLYACEAPHHNPLDPQNPDYNYRRIKGTVQTISLPLEAIAQATVRWQKGMDIAITDQQGEFNFLLSNPPSGWLYFSHPEFFQDSLFVNWSDQEIEIDVYLNALPSMDSLLVYSVVLNRFPSFQKEQLYVETYINDRDKDIDSVFAIFNDGIKQFHLPYNTTEKKFQREFIILDLGVLSLEELVGESVQIRISDVFSNSLIIGQDQLVRVIKEEVMVISPLNNITTGPSPTLEWESLITGYSFHYDLEIYTNEVAPVLIWQKKKISKEQTVYQVDTSLEAGNYFWVIWAIDQFGNRTRSKPAPFVVQI